MLWLVIVIDEG